MPIHSQLRRAALLFLSIGAACCAQTTDTPPANRLAASASPYLIQHAAQPIHWQPWDNTALDRARSENNPILLSIGYSTCHWCHIMARESFEHPEIAALLNTHFISIKVDREERPDIDQLYQSFLQATTGSSGWPATLILTPDRQPFFGGTYFPPGDRNGRPGLKTILHTLTSAWEKDQANIKASSTQMLAQLRSTLIPAPSTDSTLPSAALATRAQDELAATYDSLHGGFGAAPKFPRPSVLLFLLDGPAKTRDMALATLRRIAASPLRDQLGGGFHRYTTDRAWQIPHFEKMLSDQAQLANLYLTAYQITHDTFFADIARGILDEIVRDFTAPNHGFLSAHDAESRLSFQSSTRAEGAFYLWTKAEILTALSPDEAELLITHHRLTEQGNFTDTSSSARPGLNLLHAPATPPSDPELRARLALAQQRLLSLRQLRPRPDRDEKIITAWNGLAVSALARASRILDNPGYLRAATNAAHFLATHHHDAVSGQLLRSTHFRTQGPPAFAEDYAFLIHGLLGLYETTADPRWLELSLNLQNAQDRLFGDAAEGGYFISSAADASIPLRSKLQPDGAEPSANSLSLQNLARLAALLDRPAFRQRAEKLFSAHARPLQKNPSAYPQLLSSARWLWREPMQILITGKPQDPAVRPFLAILNRHALPPLTLVFADSGPNQNYLGKQSDFLAKFSPSPRDPIPALYICTGQTCQRPISTPEKLAAYLAALAP